jgi:CDP-glycerol glycerophosphotransferase
MRRLGAVTPDFFINVSTYPDVRDLYCAADVLVTDYSSALFDFALTGRPIICFVWDLETYRGELRGHYLNLEDMAPGPLVETGAELAIALREVPSLVGAYAERYAALREKFCGLEDGNASARVWDAVTPAENAR